MNSYKKITYKYLKQQRNRTLLTILGIIISVAMISSIGTIIEGVRGVMIQDAINNYGNYHVSFRNLDKSQINNLKNHVAVEKVGISKTEGFARIAEITEEEKELFGEEYSHRHIKVEGYDEKALEILPFQIDEGRFPKDSNEIAIEKWMTNYFKGDIEIGDKITLSMFHGNTQHNGLTNYSNENIVYEFISEREYTLVGYIEPKNKWIGNFITTGITGIDVEYMGENYYSYFTLTNIKNAEGIANNVAKDIGLDLSNIGFNDKLLRLSAESTDEILNKNVKLLLVFIVGLIVISTIAVIYNAFNISVLERISQFGLLRAVGATPGQVRGVVFKEAFILSLISIPIGFLSGLGAMKIVFYIISKIRFSTDLLNNIEVRLSLTVFLLSTVIGLITVFLSALGPARKAGKVSPMEAIRNEGSFKKETFKRVTSSRFVRKILGIEGEIAYKNLRRNRKRFIITVFSMVISISLFITFSTFSDYMFKAGFIQDSTIGNFSVWMRDTDKYNTIHEELKSITDVKRVYKIKEVNGEALLLEDKVNRTIKEVNPFILDENKEGFIKIENINVYTIGDENFDLLKSTLRQGTLNYNELEADNGVLVINSTFVYNRNTNKRRLIEGYSLKPGDKVQFSPYSLSEESDDVIYKELEIIGVLDKGILNEGYNMYGAIDIITTETNLQNILGDSTVHNSRLIIEMENNANLLPIREYLEEKQSKIPYFNYSDYAKWAEDNRSAVLVISIFLYGFVTLITLISSINIINTISTNIILRTREISMIKAVGMTQSGIKRMVALESLFYGLYATIFGGTIGTGLAYTMYKLVIGLSEFDWYMPWKNIAIACIGAAIVALFSGILPLKRINEGIIVENMRGNE